MQQIYEITLRHVCSPVICCINSEHLFLRTPLGDCNSIMLHELCSFSDIPNKTWYTEAVIKWCSYERAGTFNCFFLSFLLMNRILRLINFKTRTVMNTVRKYQCLLFVLKRSYICYYIICMCTYNVRNMKYSTENINFIRKFHKSMSFIT